MKNKLAFYALGHAAAAFAYITAVVSFISYLERAWGNQEDGLWAPIIGLTLFVLSAAIMGALVLGRPILLYLDGKKSEAVRFFGYTIGWLFVIFIILIAVRLWQ